MHDAARLAEAFRRAVLRRFVCPELFVENWEVGMVTWPHSDSHVEAAVRLPEVDRAFATRLARNSARYPVALERLAFDRTLKAVAHWSEKSEGPTAGPETVEQLETLGRVLVQIHDRGNLTSRHHDRYANWQDGICRQATPAATDGRSTFKPTPPVGRTPGHGARPTTQAPASRSTASAPRSSAHAPPAN